MKTGTNSSNNNKVNNANNVNRSLAKAKAISDANEKAQQLAKQALENMCPGLNDAMTSNAALKFDNDALKDDNDALQFDNKNMKANNDALKMDYFVLKFMNEDMKVDINKLTAENARLKELDRASSNFFGFLLLILFVVICRRLISCVGK